MAGEMDDALLDLLEEEIDRLLLRVRVGSATGEDREQLSRALSKIGATGTADFS